MENEKANCATSSITVTVSGQRWNFCPECGRKLEADWKHCPGCGLEIGQQAALWQYVPYYVPQSAPYYPPPTIYPGGQPYPPTTTILYGQTGYLPTGFTS